MLKISEECAKMLDHYKSSKTQLEQQAMAIACLVEFDSMAQALSQHEMSMIDNLTLSPRLGQTKENMKTSPKQRLTHKSKAT